jgi:hypothetical protein
MDIGHYFYEDCHDGTAGPRHLSPLLCHAQVSVGSMHAQAAAGPRALKRPFLWPSRAARSPDSEAGREAASLCAAPAWAPSRLLALLRAPPSPGVVPAGARRCASMSAPPFATTGDSGGGTSP